MRPGVVRWIGLRPARRAPVLSVDAAAMDPATGLAGDHYAGRAIRTRQVTLIGTEDLAAIASFLGCVAVAPEVLRRNIVISGLNLHAVKGRRLRLGDAVLEATGLCHPCTRMEEALGPGGYSAVRGHGGITARVVRAGGVGLGDSVTVVGDPPYDDAFAARQR